MAGPTAHRRQHVEWRVKVWTDLGESDWSDPAWFETGFSTPPTGLPSGSSRTSRSRAARGHGPHTCSATVHARQAASRRRVSTPRPTASTRPSSTGGRVGDLELTPGFTSLPGPPRTSRPTTSPNSSCPATNVWEVVLSDGWYRGRTGISADRRQLRRHRRLPRPARTSAARSSRRRPALAVGHRPDPSRPTSWPDRSRTDGSSRPSGTGRRRRPRPRAADDAHRHRRSGACRSCARSPSPGLDPDRQVVDLGQNINGWVRLTDLGPPGTDAHARPRRGARRRAATSPRTTRGRSTRAARLAVGQIDRVVSAGRAGRGVRTAPHDARLPVRAGRRAPAPAHARRRHAASSCTPTCAARAGSAAATSAQPLPRDRRLELPRQRVRHPDRLPPTRAGRLDRRLAGLRPERRVPLRRRRVLARSGCATSPPTSGPTAVCRTSRPTRRDPRPWPKPRRCARLPAGLGGVGRRGRHRARGRCARVYGDDGVLAELWPTMVAWVELRRARVARTPATRRVDRRRPEPGTARGVPVGRRFHWGEWREPGVDDEQWYRPTRVTSATAYLHHSAALAGADRAAARARRARPSASTSSRATSLDAVAHRVHRRRRLPRLRTRRPTTSARSPSVSCPTSCASADRRPPRRAHPRRRHPPRHRLPRHAVPAAGARRHRPPRRRLRAAPPGHAAVVARRWSSAAPPRCGRTGTGIDDDGTADASLNHYSKGAVISFLHTYVAGIQALDDHPGYRRFRIAPQPGGGLTWAEARARLALRPHRVVVAYRPRPVSPDGDRPPVHLCRDRPPGRHDRRTGPRHRHPPVHAGSDEVGRVGRRGSLCQAREPLHTVRSAS